MIELSGFHHVSITVTDLEKSKHFYGNVLGLKEIARPNFQFEGAWYEIGQQQIHLIVHEKAKTFRNSELIDTKDSHIAFRVKDYDQTLKILKENNVPHKENHGTRSGLVQIFCTDPDYHLIELNVDL